MTVMTLSSREFNQDVGRAKKSARSGPVIITDRGKPAHVLLSFDEYRELTAARTNIADLLAMPGAGEVKLSVPRRLERARPANLS